ncbi:tRNA pseudouridine55 synthase [Bowdeniella nasicola]|uniref:tRNA pseudouridine synthase B n=1 Tax=Bowdeniella nasicola TaxID=208480 RepID=A0A1H4CZE4_9ACTO|nr:tRNA pseudouridine(55) synthase TruB [Bowdeniella nasicola]SEA65873.1 tRNA pseudouridine55 synthase [Bowdeniella nasicola]
MSNGPSGFVLIDKPAGPTSHGVVAALRRELKTRKVGHAGTLDPMATGLLIAGVGRATRLLTYLVGLDKTYEATIRLGEATTTDDAEGEFLSAAAAAPASDDATAPDAFRLSDAQILSALEAFHGDILQRPTAVSAIKVDGKRAYDRVRAGEDVELAARPVTIHELELVSGPTPTTGKSGAGVIDLSIRTRVSSGTYIRAIARDLGAALGVGGHLTSLKRSAVGPFTLDDASELAAPELLDPLAVMSRVLPVREVSEAEAADLAQGRFLDPVEPPEPASASAPAPTRTSEFALAACDGRLIAVITTREGKTRPVIVLEAQ